MPYLAVLRLIFQVFCSGILVRRAYAGKIQPDCRGPQKPRRIFYVHPMPLALSQMLGRCGRILTQPMLLAPSQVLGRRSWVVILRACADAKRTQCIGLHACPSFMRVRTQGRDSVLLCTPVLRSSKATGVVRDA